MIYIRVETINNNIGETIGGYVCAMQALLAINLGITPTDNVEELTLYINESNNPDVERIIALMYSLNTIPHPDVYMNDRNNYICLYQQSEFLEHYAELEEISLMLIDKTNGRINLIYKEFDISEDEIIYEDLYQIVISKDTYEKYNTDSAYTDMLGEDIED